jgi:hypothetical protein
MILPKYPGKYSGGRMPGYQWIEHKGKKILFIDLSCRDLAELDKVIEKVKPVIAAEPLGSVRCLTSVEGGLYNITMTRSLQEFTTINKPYILKTVLLGIKGVQLTIYRSVLTLTGRTNMVLKGSRQEALDFLAEE